MTLQTRKGGLKEGDLVSLQHKIIIHFVVKVIDIMTVKQIRLARVNGYAPPLVILQGSDKFFRLDVNGELEDENIFDFIAGPKSFVPSTSTMAPTSC